ncbi:hat family dimerization domaincontaining protein-related [Holotrichia oblita]|uniref:Hat family dimerization domaincontaining protein-related n=1 Tax=Holotrichia oblita TaxID=644536 RepID=A0ACB9TMA1_HOLOL|nr:hat family dimerization domaincontaining protein-related [Holotrichia oblita]
MANIYDGLFHIMIGEEINNARRRNRHRIIQRNIRDMSNPYELPEKKFLKLFRLDKHASRELVNELSNFMEAESRATHIPKHIRVLTTLHFLGHGSYQCGVGCSYSFALSQPAVSRCIREVTDVMVTNLLNQWIKFPNTRNEFNALKQDFTEEFPLFRNLVGVIDGTQIQIIAPPQHHEIYPAAPY